MQLVRFCLKLWFIYVDIGSMWVFGYPYILYFVLHGLNSMRPTYMYMHLWNDVMAGLDSGLLTMGLRLYPTKTNADILFIYTPNQTPDMLTNTNNFEIVIFRIILLCYWQTRILTTFAHAQTNRRASRVSALGALVFSMGCSWTYIVGCYRCFHERQ